MSTLSAIPKLKARGHTVVDPEEILSEKAYRNYRNVRAVALLFIIFGSLLSIAVITFPLTVALQPEPRKDLPEKKQATLGQAILIGAFVSIFGLSGVIGGFATRAGNKRWAHLVKGIAFIYLFCFPIGTILSLVLLLGFEDYLLSIDRIREKSGS